MIKRMIKIDGVKLEKELHKRNLTKSRVSQELGYGDTFMTNTTKRNLISESAAIMLKQLYNIDVDAYANREEQEEPLNDKKPAFSLDYEKLNEILYDAVFRAVRDALKG